MKVRVRVSGYRAADCGEAARALTGILGPATTVGRPQDIRVWAIHKSPHVYGRSKEVYGRVTHKSDLYFQSNRPEEAFRVRVRAALQAAGRLYPVHRSWEYSLS